MSSIAKVGQNTIIQFVSKIGSIILGVITIAIMARELGLEGFGIYSTIVAYLQFFGILVDFGLQLAMVNLMSNPAYDENRVYQNAMSLRIISAIVLFALAPVLILAFPYEQSIKTGVLILTLNFFALAINQILIGLFQKKLQISKTAVAELTGKTLTLVGIFTVSYFKLGLYAMLGAISIASLIQVALLFFFSINLYKFKFSFDKDYWLKIFSESWPIAISIMFNLIYFKADTLILSLTRTQSEVGIYSAPYRVLEILTQFPYLFVGIIFPLIASSWSSGDFEKYKYWFQKTFDALVVSAIPLIFGALLLAEKIMVFVAGSEFADSALVLQIIIFATAIIFINVIFGYSIVILGKQRVLIFGYIITAIIALLLYLIFIPKYSYIAAAVITIFSELLIFAINYYVSVKTSGFSPKLKIIFKSLIASLGMAGVVYFAKDLHILLIILISFPVYAFLLYLVGGYSKQTIKEILTIRS